MRIYCAECDNEIKPGESYFTYQDNAASLLFENKYLNLFCSKECAGKALMLEDFTLEKWLIKYWEKSESRMREVIREKD